MPQHRDTHLCIDPGNGVRVLQACSANRNWPTVLWCQTSGHPGQDLQTLQAIPAGQEVPTGRPAVSCQISHVTDVAIPKSFFWRKIQQLSSGISQTGLSLH